MTQGATAGAPRDHRRAIPLRCALHRGPRGFATLVEKKPHGEIVLDPQVTGAYVIILDEAAVSALVDVLRTWRR